MKHAFISVSFVLRVASLAFCPAALTAANGIGAVEPMPGYVFFNSIVHDVAEGSTHAKLTVAQWSGSIDRVFPVGYSTEDGSAVAGTDYQAVSGRLEFGDGVFTRHILIPLIDDADAEGIETFTVTLSGHHVRGARKCTVAIPKRLFRTILRRISRLGPLAPVPT